jgi:transposase
MEERRLEGGHLLREGQHYRESIRGPPLVSMLRHLRSRIGQPLIVILDRAAIHRSRLERDYLSWESRIMVEWPPPYAPELRMEEYCHGKVKQQIRNTTSISVVQMQERADRNFNRLRKRLDLLLSFFRHAGLDVNQLAKVSINEVS